MVSIRNILRFGAGLGFTTATFMMQVSPSDAASNLSLWLSWIGSPPHWTQNPQIDVFAKLVFGALAFICFWPLIVSWFSKSHPPAPARRHTITGVHGERVSGNVLDVSSTAGVDASNITGVDVGGHVAHIIDPGEDKPNPLPRGPVGIRVVGGSGNLIRNVTMTGGGDVIQVEDDPNPDKQKSLVVRFLLWWGRVKGAFNGFFRRHRMK